MNLIHIFKNMKEIKLNVNQMRRLMNFYLIQHLFSVTNPESGAFFLWLDKVKQFIVHKDFLFNIFYNSIEKEK